MQNLFIAPFYRIREFGPPVLHLAVYVLPLWLAWRLYRHRVLRRPASLQRETLLLVALGYLLCLAVITLAPNHGSVARAASTAGVALVPDLASLTCSSASPPGTPNAQAFCRQNAGGNVLVFIPFGFLLPLVWRGVGFRRGLLVAVLFSCGIEILQYLSRAWGSYRSADVNDVILNAVGAGIGLALIFLPRWRRGPREAILCA